MVVVAFDQYLICHGGISGGRGVAIGVGHCGFPGIFCYNWNYFSSAFGYIVCLHLKVGFGYFFARKSPGQNSRKSGVILLDCSNHEESLGFVR